MFHLSEPIHKLQVEMRKANEANTPLEFDVVVIGSGYGGAVAAARFAQAGLKVLVLERGKEYVPGEFPNNLSEVPSHVRIEFNNEAKPWGYEEALFDIRIGGETATILGNGLGGGSQINANVALEPDPSIFTSNWPKAITATTLAPYFDKVRSVIGLTALSFTEAEQRFPKARALGRLAANEGDTATKKKPLLFKQPVTPIAVKLSDLPYTEQQPEGVFSRADCTGCGNCVSGCNVGAKGTLTTNYLPIARGFDAQIYTGATALAVEKINGKWQVTGIPTSQRGRLRTWEESGDKDKGGGKPWVTGGECDALKDQFFQINVDRVVLSAGTLGTAEILQRSTKGKHRLTLSNMLGEKFSGNGDYVAFSYGESEDSVNAVGWSTKEDEERDRTSGQSVGPTITATLVPQGVASTFIIQDGAIPGPIAPAVRELWAFSNALSGSDKPFDPIALDPRGLSHTQTFLGIGIDSAEGKISANAKTGRVHVAWPTLKNLRGDIDSYGSDIRNTLKPAAERVGGTYLDNPTWKLLPPFLEAMLGKDKAMRGVNPISHPLGGCVMADDAEHGVVDHCGRVFSSVTGSDVHPGLYVLDGSMIHGAVGKNPFLTIAALAERAVDRIINEEKLQRVAHKFTLFGKPKLTQPTLALTSKRPVGIALSEVLRGSFKSKSGKQELHASLDLTFSVDDFEKWQANLSTPFVVSQNSRFRVKTAAGISIFKLVKGKLKIIGPVRFKSQVIKELSYDKMRSLATYEAMDDWPKILEIIHRLRDRFNYDAASGGDWIELLMSEGSSLINVLMNSMQSRDIAYDLTFEFESGQSAPSWIPSQVRLTGGKRIAMYTGWNPPKQRDSGIFRIAPLLIQIAVPQKNIFRMVTQPTLRIEPVAAEGQPPQEPLSKDAVFEMDLSDTLHRNLPQILSGDTSHGLVALMGYPMAFLRFTVRSLLLSFRVPGYVRDFGLMVADRAGVIEHTSGNVDDIKPTHWLPVIGGIQPILYGLSGFTSVDGKELRLALWRYKQAILMKSDEKAGEPRKCKAVLMLHAFGQSALSFADTSIEGNGAKVLHKAGYDVWLLEYRTSTALDGETKAWADDSYVEPCRRAATMDEVAEHDIPAAVKFIRQGLAEENGGASFQIFTVGQCVGSASLAMSALDGRLKDNPQDDKDWLAAMVLSQFMPYCIAGEGAQARTSVPGFLRNVLRIPGVNFSTLDTAREAEEAAAFAIDGVNGVRQLKGTMLPRAADAYQSTMTDTLIDVIAGVYPTDDNEVHHGERRSTPSILKTQAEVTTRRILMIEAPLFRQENLSKATFRRLPILFGHANIELFDHARRCVEYERLVDKDGRNVYVTQENIVKNLTMPICLLHGVKSDLFAVESTVRTARLIAGFRGDSNVRNAADTLYDYTNETQMRTVFLPDQGHLDPIIGTKSGETFDQVAQFFDDVFAGRRSQSCPVVTQAPTGKTTSGCSWPSTLLTE